MEHSDQVKQIAEELDPFVAETPVCNKQLARQFIQESEKLNKWILRLHMRQWWFFDDIRGELNHMFNILVPAELLIASCDPSRALSGISDGYWKNNSWHAIARSYLVTALALKDKFDHPQPKGVRIGMRGERLAVQAKYLIDEQVTGDSSPEDTFIPDEIQRAILRALDGKALKVDKLAAACNCERGRFYGKQQRLPQLRERGYVDHKHGIGFFRPDALPPGLAHKLRTK